MFQNMRSPCVIQPREAFFTPSSLRLSEVSGLFLMMVAGLAMAIALAVGEYIYLVRYKRTNKEVG